MQSSYAALAEALVGHGMDVESAQVKARSMMTPEFTQGVSHILNSPKLNGAGRKQAMKDLVYADHVAPEDNRVSPVAMASEIAKNPTYQGSVLPGVAQPYGTWDVAPDLASERLPFLNAIGPLRDTANVLSGAGTTYTDAQGMPQKGELDDTYTYESGKNMNTILVAQTRSAEKALKAAHKMMAKDTAKGKKMLDVAMRKSTYLQKAITKVVGDKGLAAATKGAPYLQSAFVAKGLLFPSKSVKANIARFRAQDQTDAGATLLRGGVALFDPETQGAAITQVAKDTTGLVGDLASARSVDELGDMAAGVGEGSGVLDYGRRSDGKRSLGWSPEEIAGEEANKFKHESNKIPGYKGESVYGGFREPDYYSQITPERRAEATKYLQQGYQALPPQSYTAQGTKGHTPEGYFRVRGNTDSREIIRAKDMPKEYATSLETVRHSQDRSSPGTTEVIPVSGGAPTPNVAEAAVPAIKAEFNASLSNANRRTPAVLPDFPKL